MGFIRRTLVGGALAAGAGYAGYRLLLDEAARENLRLAFGRIANVAEEIADRVGTLQPDDSAVPEVDVREDVRRQWESLGL